MQNNIDLLVAQAIDANGDQPWVWGNSSYADANGTATKELQKRPLCFSTDPKAAWRLWKHMLKSGWKMIIDLKVDGYITLDYGNVHVHENKNLMEALCLAVIKAKGGE